MKRWLISVTAHGWEDDIDSLVFVSDRLLSDSEVHMEFNSRFAGKKKVELEESGNAFFPIWSDEDDVVSGIEVDEDGFFKEQNSNRSVWVREEEVEI